MLGACCSTSGAPVRSRFHSTFAPIPPFCKLCRASGCMRSMRTPHALPPALLPFRPFFWKAWLPTQNRSGKQRLVRWPSKRGRPHTSSKLRDACITLRRCKASSHRAPFWQELMAAEKLKLFGRMLASDMLSKRNKAICHCPPFSPRTDSSTVGDNVRRHLPLWHATQEPAC